MIKEGLEIFLREGPALLRFFIPVPKGRREAIGGSWVGDATTFAVEDDSEGRPFTMHMDFTAGRRKKVTGDAIVVGIEGRPDQIPLQLVGGFFHDDYLQFVYKSKREEFMQFGVLMLKMNPKGNEMVGHYAGFSPFRETKPLIHGRVNLKKG